MSRRRILVTSALPYVNSDLHLGYLVEAIQTDVWRRFQTLRGHEIRYFCGDDTHGTATMLRAQKEGRPPEDLLSEMQRAHEADLNAFGVFHDRFRTAVTEDTLSEPLLIFAGEGLFTRCSPETHFLFSNRLKSFRVLEKF